MEEPIPAQVPATEHRVPVSGVQLWCWDTGGPGEAIVLCHPASQSGECWLHQQPVLAAAGYRVVGYSRRGHKGSPPGAAGEPGSLVGDLAAVLDHLGIARAHVLGAAAGGITATGLAVAAPGRVASLIIAGSIVAPDEEEWRRLYARLGIAAVRAHVPTEFLELGPSYRAACPDGVARFAALEHASKPYGAMPPQPLGTRVDWLALERLALPVLLVTGEADLFAPPPLQALIARHLRGAEPHTMRAIGHAPYWEAPTAFNRLLLDFLARHPTSPGAARNG